MGRSSMICPLGQHLAKPMHENLPLFSLEFGLVPFVVCPSTVARFSFHHPTLEATFKSFSDYVDREISKRVVGAEKHAVKTRIPVPKFSIEIKETTSEVSST